MGNMLATSTWSSRAARLTHMEHFAKDNDITNWPMSAQAVAFLSSQRHLKKSTLRNYASQLRSTAHLLGETSTTLLDWYSKGVAISAAVDEDEVRRAVPATREQVQQLIEWLLARGLRRVATVVALMRKTASRYNDVAILKKTAIIGENQERGEILLQWATTKTNRTGEVRAYTYTIVKETQRPELLRMISDVISNLPNDETLMSDLTTNQFNRLVQRCPATAELTAHSFKRGAASDLARAAANGLIDFRLIPLVLKHRDHLHDYPMTTLVYIQDKWAIARALGTASATALL